MIRNEVLDDQTETTGIYRGVQVDAVRLVTDEGYTFAEAGRSLGVRGDMISRWKRRLEAAEAPRPGQRHRPDLPRLDAHDIAVDARLPST